MLLINATLYTMEDTGVLPNAFLETEGSGISRIGRMDELPEGEKSGAVDLGGAAVYPGLIDAHTHLGMWEDSLGFEGDDGNEDTDPSTPQLRGIDAVNPCDRAFSEAVEAGITAVLTGPGSANPVAGQIAAVSTYGRRIDDMLLAAPVAIKFALGENPKTTYHGKSAAPVTRMATAAIIREQLLRAARYREELRRAETDEDFDRPEFDFKCEALLPLLDGEIKAHFHAHRADDIFTAVRIAKEFSLDYVIVHGTGGAGIADLLAAEGCGILCGPILCDRCKPELRELSPDTPAVLERAGVPLAIITDHPETPIQYLPLCAAVAVQNGLSREGALRALTIDAAKLCGIDRLVGSLRVGKRADFIVFCNGKDPLTLGTRPYLVVIGGEIAAGTK
ncbi:MAG: amidohydrolase [Candidatus Howiella sp.]